MRFMGNLQLVTSPRNRSFMRANCLHQLQVGSFFPFFGFFWCFQSSIIFFSVILFMKAILIKLPLNFFKSLVFDRGDKQTREQEEGETTIAIPVDIPGSHR